MRNLFNTLVCLTIFACPFTPNNREDGGGSSSDTTGEDRSRSDALPCICYDEDEIRRQLLELGCSGGGIDVGCRNSPITLNKDGISPQCYDVNEAIYGSCPGFEMMVTCLDCCKYTTIELVDDHVETCMNEHISIDILHNDTYSGQYQFLDIIQPLHGNVVRISDLSFVYTPDADFVGNDRFEYFLEDSCGPNDMAAVTIEVRICGDGG